MTGELVPCMACMAGVSSPDTAEVMPANGASDRPTRILLVGDHQLVRSSLRALIDLEPDLVVIGEAGTAAEAIEKVETDTPDLALMDVRLPERSGISACQDTRWP